MEAIVRFVVELVATFITGGTDWQRPETVANAGTVRVITSGALRSPASYLRCIMLTVEERLERSGSARRAG